MKFRKHMYSLLFTNTWTLYRITLHNLDQVWKNYKANNITTSVDPAILGSFVAEDASNALQVSLLCTQSSPPLRPAMSDIIQMLTKKDYNIPIPIQQPFINYTRLTRNNRTASTVSFTSIGHASSRSSFHSTTSSLHQGEEVTLLENSFSSSKFNSSRSPDSDIQVNIVLAQPTVASWWSRVACFVSRGLVVKDVLSITLLPFLANCWNSKSTWFEQQFVNKCSHWILM